MVSIVTNTTSSKLLCLLKKILTKPLPLLTLLFVWVLLSWTLLVERNFTNTPDIFCFFVSTAVKTNRTDGTNFLFFTWDFNLIALIFMAVKGAVGTTAGAAVGLDMMGLAVGLDVGLATGLEVGLDAGVFVGLTVGFATGFAVGLYVGLATGLAVGLDIGVFVGLDMGLAVGLDTGLAVGLDIGVFVGLDVGLFTGLVVGLDVGPNDLVGFSVGLAIGESVTAGFSQTHT